MKDLLQKDLLQDLRSISGLPIDNGNQCKILSEEIFKSTGDHISWQSLRRVLGFINSSSQPTIYTLNIISRFLGFDSYSAYLRSKQTKKGPQESNSIMKMMENTFNIKSHKKKDFNYHFVCRGLSRFYYDNHELLPILPKELYKFPLFKEYFIGHFPLLDLTDRGFKKLLLQHPQLESDNEVKLFVNSVSYLHNFKAGKPNKDEIVGLDLIDITGVHPFVVGRYYGVKLHLAKNKKERMQVVEEVKMKLNTSSEQEQMAILFTFLDYAIGLEMYTEVLDFLDGFDPNPTKFKKWFEFGYYEVFKIYRLLSLTKTKQYAEAKMLSKKTSMAGVAFYFRKTFQLMYLEAMIILEKETNRKRLLEEELKEVKGFLFVD